MSVGPYAIEKRTPLMLSQAGLPIDERLTALAPRIEMLPPSSLTMVSNRRHINWETDHGSTTCPQGRGSSKCVKCDTFDLRAFIVPNP
jgi:hypothetical protein